MKKYYVATFELTRLAPVLLLYTMLAPLVMFPEAKFYNVSMIKVDQTLDSMSPKFEELAFPFSECFFSIKATSFSIKPAITIYHP